MPLVSSMNSLFSSLFLVRWCGRLVGEDLVEDYNAFRVERRGRGRVSRRRETVKWDCRELTANFSKNVARNGIVLFMKCCT